MLYAIAEHKIDRPREDVYLASVDDQQAVLAGSEDFHGRTVLRHQVNRGAYWLLDGWTDESAMQMGLASARTLSSVAALVEEPREILTAGEELSRRPSAEVDGSEGEDPFFIIADTWVKTNCLPEYLDTVRAEANRLSGEAGFRRRLLLTVRGDDNHFYVMDQWAGERAAYESFQSRAVSQIEATRFLSLLSERGRPILATGIKVEV
ncbi:MAG: hypothetical protein PVS2B1_17370 [Candidatus Dormibacteraceae bacterium]